MSVAIIPTCAYSLFLTVVLRLSSHTIKLTLLNGAVQQILVYSQSCASIIPHYRIFSSPQNESSYSFMEMKISILDVCAEWLSGKILPKWQIGIWSSSLRFPYPVSLRVQSIQMGSGWSPVGWFHHSSLEVAHKAIRTQLIGEPQPHGCVQL